MHSELVKTLALPVFFGVLSEIGARYLDREALGVELRPKDVEVAFSAGFSKWGCLNRLPSNWRGS